MADLPHILVIDDDAELCELLGELLAQEGYVVESARDAATGLALVGARAFALVVLDVMLPGMNGFEVLTRIRQSSRVPVLMLTARGEDVDRIVGLEMGADDYLPKPFNPRELIARLRAILRRTAQTAAGESHISIGDITLDPAAREAWVDKRRIDLTSVQYALLEVLARDAGHVVTRQRLNELVLGRELSAFDRSIDVHVSNLRKKLGDLPEGERIKAVRGAGYLLVRSKTKRK